MKLKFNFEDAQFASLNGKEYLLSDAEDKAAVEEALGIALPEIGATEAGIDLSGVVSRMQTHAGATVNNTIEVDVMANDRWSSEDESVNRVYKLVCNKPVFRIDAYPGNIWTKEFTVNALREEQVESGNFSAISESITYQYSTDQSEWFALSDGMRQDKLKPGTTYYIRGLYRGVIPGEVAEVTTYPETPLENGGLEGGYISKGQDKNSSQYGAVYMWNGWSTLNELTCDDTHAFIWGNTAFNSRSGTRPAEPREESSGSQSVWIMTMGYGYGGTSAGEFVTPSELFLGTLTNVNHDDDEATKNYGISYKSRPTGLKFYYKYTPYNGDSSDIYIQIKGADNEILGLATLNESNVVNNFTEIKLSIIYNSEYARIEPATLVVVFKSGFNSEVYDYGSWSLMGSNSAEPSHRGSELFIDDVELVYDK